jgi:HEAT repeat protein
MPNNFDTNAHRSNASLINDLASDNFAMVHHVRQSLVQRGHAAVPDLLQALENSNSQIQWEAARTLEEIHDPASAPVLVDALTKDNFLVNWVASTALGNLQKDGLPLVLQALVKQSDSSSLRRGAHHVLHAFAKGQFASVIKPVLEALEDTEPALGVPIAATQALEALKKTSAHA